MTDYRSHGLEQVLHRTYGKSLVDHYTRRYIPVILDFAPVGASNPRKSKK